MFCKSVGHDDRDCRAYDLMHERSSDIYKIQGEVQQEGNTITHISLNLEIFSGSRILEFYLV